MYSKLSLLVLIPVLAISRLAAAGNSPVSINPKWEGQGVKVQIIEHLIEKYFEHPYRYNYDNPTISTNKIDEYYYAMEGVHLPSSVREDIKNDLIKHQSSVGKQNGFENTGGLATTLPRKQIVSVSTAAN